MQLSEYVRQSANITASGFRPQYEPGEAKPSNRRALWVVIEPPP
jgi:hypothetical protein